MWNVRRGSWRCGRGSIAEAVAEAVNNFLSTRKGKKPKLTWLSVSRDGVLYSKCLRQWWLLWLPNVECWRSLPRLWLLWCWSATLFTRNRCLSLLEDLRKFYFLRSKSKTNHYICRKKRVPGCSLDVTPNYENKIMDSFHTFLQLHLSSFASTASKDVCPDLRCLDIVTGLIDRPRCVGLGSAVDPFLCPPVTPVDDSNTPCTIDRSLVDNNQCDCPATCADESSWTCQNCSCVSWYITSKFSMVLLYFAVPFSYSPGGQAGKWATTEIMWGCYMASLLFLILIDFIDFYCMLLCLFPIETWNFSKGELLWSSALWVQGWWWNFPMPRDARFQLQPSSESSKQRSVRLSRDLCGWGPNPKLWRTGFSSELRGLPMSWCMWTVLVFLVKYCASQLQLPATSGSWNLCLWAILGTTATFSMSTTWRMLVATVLCEWQCLRLSRNMCRWGWLELWYLHLSGSVWDKESQLFWFAFSLPRQLLYNQHFPRQRRELWLPHLCWWGSFYLWNLQCRMSHWTELQQFARISMRSSSFFLPSYIGWNDLLPIHSQLCEWQRLRLPRLLWWTELGLLQLFCGLHGVSPLGTSFRIPSGAEPKYSEIGELLRWCFGAWVWSAMSWLPSPDSFASHTSRM